MIGLDPKTGKWVLYESPAGKKSGKSVGPYGFSIDHKGDIWFGEYGNNAIGRLDPQDRRNRRFPGAHPECHSAQGHHGCAGQHLARRCTKPASLSWSIRTIPDQMKTFTPPEEHPGTYSLSADLKNGYIWASLQSYG